MSEPSRHDVNTPSASTGMKRLALKALSSLYKGNEPLTGAEVEALKSRLQDLGEYEDGMALEEIACLVLLYEIEQSRARGTSTGK